ncbi:MAG: DUF2889 domain-containing protein [Rhodospirillales bacterium]|jgi:hypothetical protein|nr:DUF2889 domain-containing protein [Rhodospirillales bacterium]MBT4006587.1 DUF2889 domain-containing protein [Rhodospirillales bacterium]MBT5076017.1 DUF2889 domain-containing protein [Rhodospirillales bacterium]MBT5113865.1 DUF2889 domain-containing protein [Rhodospirillales bacterium]MBT5672393.1 DUF2889 domain-containing protein [Rhodospirillales bacterium]
MPLSDPVARNRRHNRTIDLSGYEREDGLWDIEGHLRDIKGYTFNNSWRGDIKAGEPVHDMWIRITVDITLTIKSVEASIDSGPHPICPDIAPDFKILEGICIAPGWNRKVRELLGGVKGCVHLVEMLGPLATVAFQTLGPSRALAAQDQAKGTDRKKPARIDTCHVFKSDGDAVKERWPEFYKGS